VLKKLSILPCSTMGSDFSTFAPDALSINYGDIVAGVNTPWKARFERGNR